MNEIPAPSRTEYLLEQILKQLIELNQKLTPIKKDENEISVEPSIENDIMAEEDINMIIEKPVDIYENLKNDKTIAENTKKNYRKHIKVIEKMIKKPLIKLNKKKIKKKLLLKICQKYDNLNTRISYLSSLKYILKCFDFQDLCDINKCFQDNRNELNKQKSINNKANLSSIDKAQKIWNNLLNYKTDIPFLKMLIEIYNKLGVIRSSELLGMKLYYDVDSEKYDCEMMNYIDLKSKKMIIRDHKTKKSIGTKVIDLSYVNLDIFKKNVSNGSYIFKQVNNPLLIYKDSTGFNKVIKSHINVDYTTLRQVKVSLTFAFGDDQDKEKLSEIHGTSLNVMTKEYQSFVKVV